MEKFIRGKYVECLVTEIQKQDLQYIKYVKANSTELYDQVMRANPYKIGDIVIGNSCADIYGATRPGYKGLVTNVYTNGNIQLDGHFTVYWWCFDKVTTVKREYIRLYSRSQVNKFVQNTKFHVMQNDMEVGTSKLKRCFWPVCAYYDDNKAIVHITRKLVGGTQVYKLTTPKPTKPAKTPIEIKILGKIDLTKTTSKASKPEEKKSSSSMLDW